MSEQFKRRQEQASAVPSVLGDVFAPRPETPMVSVSHGPYLEELPVANMTVSQIREHFGDRLDIDPQSQAVVDGQEVDDSTVVSNGQLLTFVRKAGEKG